MECWQFIWYRPCCGGPVSSRKAEQGGAGAAGSTADPGSGFSPVLNSADPGTALSLRLTTPNFPFQLGPGQPRGRHGFHRPHDAAHLTHPASRSRSDPLDDGLAVHVGRAACPPPPCLWSRGPERPVIPETTAMSRHRRPALESSGFLLPLDVFRFRMTCWAAGHSTPFSIYYPGCGRSPLSPPRT